MSQKHLFYIFFPEQFVLRNDILVIKNEMVLHRINHVLRLEIGDGCVLFNKEKGFHCTLLSVNKKQAELEVKEEIIKQPLKKKLFLIVPIVLKEQFYDIIYSCPLFQVDTVFFVKYDKSYASWKNSDHEVERLESVFTSACEQSKNIIFPKYDKKIYSLNEILNHPLVLDSLKVYVDVGKDSFQTYQHMISLAERISVFIGPEGGFSDLEQKILEHSSDITITINPFILKSSHACFLTLGLLRTI